MRHGSQGRRSRGRGHNGGFNNGGQQQRRGNTPNRNQIFDSNGPDVRIRGTAHQVCEKYLALAKDASSTGDVVLAESYLQHAEHYQRIINSWNEEFQVYARANPGYVQPPIAADGNVSDDLALPMSILGGDTKAPDEQAVRLQMAPAQMLETA
jgi:alpha-beta hydrolase superfamily lysophospholipase